MNTFFSLDLNALAAGWRSLPTWPGPGRAQAVAAVVGDKFYLFSGFCRSYEKSGESEISYLKDAYCYSPQSGWQKLPDLPFPAAAAASPAAVVRSELLLIGGVDGTDADKAPQEFRHSSQRIQAYSVATKSWQTISRAPVGRVCVTTTEWLGRWILPTGESSPGVRSPEVWAMEAITRRE
jgi:N-acetylneuraminic acid mutarotase